MHSDVLRFKPTCSKIVRERQVSGKTLEVIIVKDDLRDGTIVSMLK